MTFVEPLAVELDAAGAGDVARLGGKAAGLASLRAAGFPVPPGVCVTTAAFRQALSPFREALAPVYRARGPLDAPAAEALSGNAMRALAGLAAPEAVRAAVRAALPAVGDGEAPVAVRSSATAEDRADVSFAGQYETALGVRGAEAILDAIVACWRSFFTAHALAARASAAALTPDEAMAVLIQPMIDAECSGVCFSVDPVRNDRDCIAINAAWGLGPGVVDGRAPADTIRMRRWRFSGEERRIVEKAARVVMAPDGGVETAPVPEERRRAACLPDGWQRRIAQLTIAAENLFGRPQDLEWAIAGDRVWVLQSRPITGLPADLAHAPVFPLPQGTDLDGSVWELDWFSRDGPVRPFDDEFFEAEAASWIEGIMNHGCGFDGQATIQERRVFHGRGYERGRPSGLHAGDSRVRTTAAADLLRRLCAEGVTPWEHVAPEIIAATKRLAEFDRATGDGGALADHLEDALGACRRHMALHWQIWLPVVGPGSAHPFNAIFAKVAGCSEGEAGDAALAVLEGAGNMFTRLMDELYAVARAARTLPPELLSGDDHSDLLERLDSRPEAAAFVAALRAFLSTYGDRAGIGSGGPSRLKTARWGEDPSPVVAMARAYLPDDVEAPEAMRARANLERDRRVVELCSRCDDAEAVAEFRRWLPYMRRARADLENHRHYMDEMSSGQVRAAVIAAGRSLAGRGAIAGRDDVFWLLRDEITDALRSDPPPDLAETVAERKARHAAWGEMVPPVILGVPSAELDPRPPLRDDVTAEAAPEEGRVKGQAASAGRRRGRARIARPGDALPEVAPGEILVAEDVYQKWTPLLPILGGLVLDGGELFQHAGTTAREYGVPAVFGTRVGTRRIAEGAWVTVDGTAGVVELG